MPLTCTGCSVSVPTLSASCGKNKKQGGLSLPGKLGKRDSGLSEFGERAEQQVEQFQDRMNDAQGTTATRDSRPFSEVRDRFKNRR